MLYDPPYNFSLHFQLDLLFFTQKYIIVSMHKGVQIIQNYFKYA